MKPESIKEKIQYWVNNNKIDNDFAKETLSEYIKTTTQEKNPELSKLFLNCTSNCNFLQSLETEELRNRWADACFDAIRDSEYSILDMFEYRNSTIPEKIYFQDLTGGMISQWSYRQVFFHIRELASAFYKLADDRAPVVAIFAENSFETACCDLACLTFDIPVTPLNTHFTNDILTYIFSLTKVNIVVTDSESRCEQLIELNKELNTKIKILFTGNSKLSDASEIIYLGEYSRKINAVEISVLLNNRKKRSIKQVATIMFTSGSTGMPKGVSFSMYNLVSKRFARAAALPEVGNNEVLLCFLPLYHTFGRYLEMLGMLYWKGTYTFCGNPSAETLLKYFPKINPTGFISIPLRWSQLHEKIVYETQKFRPEDSYGVMQTVTGNRLRWGLSAAGYLSPDTFRFFEKNNVKLCSGFGMTEATGGITMTPPGAYVENSVGRPLPGVYTELDEKGELLISGHYITHYIEEAGFNDEIEYPDIKPYKVNTGDIFRILPGGHHEIIDRVKDIYKNNKGQTIAPRIVEQKYDGVPGIKQTFLVGDGKPYNSLFIVPDNNDPVITNCTSEYEKREYFRQIIKLSNQSLPPYERVISFEILDRDFSADKNEITAKGSFNRKNILANFQHLVERLYSKNFNEYHFTDFSIRVPLWFYRDLGILEDEIKIAENCIVNIVSNKKLTICLNNDSVQIGNFIYKSTEKILDLGVIVRQPMLWCGNNELLSFYTCREGWDALNTGISTDITFTSDGLILSDSYNTKHLKDNNIIKTHVLLSKAISESGEAAYRAIEELEKIYNNCSPFIEKLIRNRLFAFAFHATAEVRHACYRILLLDEPDSGYEHLFSWFLTSGKSFIDSASIEKLAFSGFEKRRLEALRKRLYSYRQNSIFPIENTILQQLADVFEMLVKFVDTHPEFYNSVRAELSSWSLISEDKTLAEKAEKNLTALYKRFDEKIKNSSPAITESEIYKTTCFDACLGSNEKQKLIEIFKDKTFLKQSVMLAFDNPEFKFTDIAERGMWVYRIPSPDQYKFYRASINTINKKHYDILIILCENMDDTQFKSSILWLLSVAGYPFYPRVLPRIGCISLDQKAISLAYRGEIDAWKKICQLSMTDSSAELAKVKSNWKRLFTESFIAYFRCWKNSGYKIVPTYIIPDKVVVSELKYHEGALLRSLTDYSEYSNPLSLVSQMINNFYEKTANCFPSVREMLDINWIFDACYEAFDKKMAAFFLHELKSYIEKEKFVCPNGENIHETLNTYISKREKHFVPSLSLSTAIDEYEDWEALNSNPTIEAKNQTITELYKLYHINRRPEIERYYLYRNTFFKQSGKDVLDSFDKLLDCMYAQEFKPALQFTELSDLQYTLTSEDESFVFSKMVFLTGGSMGKMEVRKTGISDLEETAVHTVITDRYNESYTFRHPEKASETGNLYRLFYIENYPKIASSNDRHYIITDHAGRVSGGICYSILDETTVLLDAMIITGQLQKRGLGRAMAEEFFRRLSALNYKIVRTHLYQKNFFEKLDFKTDKKYGERVKFLS